MHTSPEIDAGGELAAQGGDQPLALPLSQVDTCGLALVGGKGLNLGRMVAGDLPVPDGFCLTTTAYQLVAADPTIANDVAALVNAAPADRGEIVARLHTAVAAAEMPPAIVAAVRDGYLALGDAVPVAVRSSATAEDLPDASFAGQQDTYLNVIGVDEVLAAVRRCWASLWTERSVSYRAEAGIDHREVSLAVVVQRLVDARVAGVLFTADPVTGHRGHMAIDASPGLGEAVVSGAVNPDHFVLDSDTAEVVRQRLGDKTVIIQARPTGGTSHVANPNGSKPCLTSEELRDLVDVGRRVAELFDSPQDVEWALDDAGRVWLTQARPITTLYPLPDGRPGEDRAYFCASTTWQGITRPVTPMGMSGLRLAASSVGELLGVRTADPARGPGAFAEAGMRMFLDLTPALRSAGGRKFLPIGLSFIDSRSVPLVRRLFDDPRFSITDQRRSVFPRRLLRAALRHGVPLRVLEALLWPGAARRRIERNRPMLDRRCTVPVEAAPAQRLAAVQQMILDSVGQMWARIVPIQGVGLAMLALARKLAGDTDGTLVQGVLRGLPDNVTTEMDLALWRLAEAFQANPSTAVLLRETSPAELASQHLDGTLPAEVRIEVDAFLEEYGHRAVGEADLGMPRWWDDPTQIYATLGNYLHIDDPARSPGAQFNRAADQAEERIAELVELARRRGRVRGWLMAFALIRVRRLLGVREQAKFYNIYVLGHARRHLQAIGKSLAEQGRLDHAEDVFFLDLIQLREALRGVEVRGLVADQRREYERELRRKQVPQILLSDGCAPEAEMPVEASADGALVGTPAATGTAAGRVRVVLDPLGARLEPGEILVAPSTDPGWTPLFLTASALVMETGGTNSHGAVVAREYGIPAVVGVPHATTLLHTGDQVTVNGFAGTVTPENPPSPR